MSKFSRYFARYYSASKITSILFVPGDVVILTIESLDGEEAEELLTVQQFYELKPAIGKYLVVNGDVAAAIFDESQLLALGKEITLEEAEGLFSAPSVEGFRTPPPQ